VSPLRRRCSFKRIPRTARVPDDGCRLSRPRATSTTQATCPGNSALPRISTCAESTMENRWPATAARSDRLSSFPPNLCHCLESWKPGGRLTIRSQRGFFDPLGSTSRRPPFAAIQTDMLSSAYWTDRRSRLRARPGQFRGDIRPLALSGWYRNRRTIAEAATACSKSGQQKSGCHGRRLSWPYCFPATAPVTGGCHPRPSLKGMTEIGNVTVA
jgi:hypothetical protein